MDFLRYEHIRKDLSQQDFERIALDIFRFQVENNPVYSEYVGYLGRDVREIDSLQKIPFLPIEFFKTHKVITRYTFDRPVESTVFRSSGTTGMQRSEHYVADLDLYEKSFTLGFEYFYGDIKDFVILALLPSYLERGDSSLVYMAKRLIEIGGKPESGFYLYNHEDLYKKLLALQSGGRKTILLGVSFALLDFAEKYSLDFPDLIVMETGGMKGRKREMVREELHGILKKAFGTEHIHSEYGMTELLSQAYGRDGKFEFVPWAKVVIRDMNDPFTYLPEGRSGGVNIIDLANVFSCSFIETKDIGKLTGSGFEILGRFDNSDLRGCNLMVV